MGLGGGEVFFGPHVLLPTDKARHVGEAIAMVVAETSSQAVDAAEAVEVTYEDVTVRLARRRRDAARRPGGLGRGHQ